MQVINAGTNEDGSPHFHYIAEPGEHVIVVKDAASGLHTLSDGTAVDLSPAVIAVQSEAHRDELAAHFDSLVNG